MPWQFTGDRPIYVQLIEQLTQHIVAGVHPAGSRMPSVRELAAEAGVNPNTMQRALAELEREGLVVTNRTAGRQVTEDTVLIGRMRERLADACVADFLRGLETLGFSPGEAAVLIDKHTKGGTP